MLLLRSIWAGGEIVDALALGASSRKGVEVRFLSCPQVHILLAYLSREEYYGL